MGGRRRVPWYHARPTPPPQRHPLRAPWNATALRFAAGRAGLDRMLSRLGITAGIRPLYLSALVKEWPRTWRTPPGAGRGRPGRARSPASSGLPPDAFRRIPVGAPLLAGKRYSFNLVAGVPARARLDRLVALQHVHRPSGIGRVRLHRAPQHALRGPRAGPRHGRLIRAAAYLLPRAPARASRRAGAPRFHDTAPENRP